QVVSINEFVSSRCHTIGSEKVVIHVGERQCASWVELWMIGIKILWPTEIRRTAINGEHSRVLPDGHGTRVEECRIVRKLTISEEYTDRWSIKLVLEH